MACLKDYELMIDFLENDEWMFDDLNWVSMFVLGISFSKVLQVLELLIFSNIVCYSIGICLWNSYNPVGISILHMATISVA
jgi:hypothetical protein